MTNQIEMLESIAPDQLSAATGGGLFGSAWKAMKGAYHVAKPYAKEASPFGYVAYKAHSLWHRITD